MALDGAATRGVGPRRRRARHRHRRRRRRHRPPGRTRHGALGLQQVGHPGPAPRSRRARPPDRRPHTGSRRRRLLVGPAQAPARGRRPTDAPPRPVGLVAAVVVRGRVRPVRGPAKPAPRAPPRLPGPRCRTGHRGRRRPGRRALGPRHRREPGTVAGHTTPVPGRRPLALGNLSPAVAPGHDPGRTRSRRPRRRPPAGLVSSAAPGRARPGGRAPR